MSGPGAVILNTAFRASHRLRSLLHVELLPVTQEKSLPLTCGKGMQPLFDQLRKLAARQFVAENRNHRKLVSGQRDAAEASARHADRHAFADESATH